MAAAEFEEFRNSCGEYLVLLWYYTDLVSMTSFCYDNYMVLAVIFGYFVEVFRASVRGIACKYFVSQVSIITGN